jgi:putative glutamine amidotransferase
MPTRTLPLIGIPSCVRSIHERAFHTVNDRYTSAVIDAVGGLPVLIPAIGPKADCGAILDRLDGILLTGSPSNVEPHHYGGPPSREGTLHDPDRDATTLPLIREAVRRDMPVLAICRGIQELNVALGGTLHQKVHEVAERMDHRPGPGRLEEKYGPRHLVFLSGQLARIIGSSKILVNSLHGQAIDGLAPGLVVEALAPDKTIEAVRVEKASGWAFGVQWHPEWGYADDSASLALFRAFGDACRSYHLGLRQAA